MNLNDIIVKVDAPYPELENVKEDAMTVAVLKNLASSRRGELNAVMTYIYQSVISNEIMMEFADIMEEIAIVEMMHLDMLLHAVQEFGGQPKYEDYQGTAYTTNFVNYSSKLKDILENNIRAEETAIEDYQHAIKKVTNQSLKDLFMRIIEDEKQHIKVFKQVRDSVNFLSI